MSENELSTSISSFKKKGKKEKEKAIQHVEIGTKTPIYICHYFCDNHIDIRPDLFFHNS